MPDSTNTAYVVPDAEARLRADGVSPGSVQVGPRPLQPAVDITGLAHRLGHRWALRGVTLRVEPGEVVAVIGPNGSGKTTLLRVLATALTPTRGSARVFGYDVVAQADAVRGAVAMLGHSTGLYDDLTPAENLAFALEMCGSTAGRSAVDSALAAVGMAEHADETVRTHSSGMRRRVALARVMLRRPRLLLLDEPYNSFDDAGVALVDGLVSETVRGGGAVLVVTHDLSRDAGVRYDRVVALDSGRVVDRRPAARWEAT